MIGRIKKEGPLVFAFFSVCHPSLPPPLILRRLLDLSCFYARTAADERDNALSLLQQLQAEVQGLRADRSVLADLRKQLAASDAQVQQQRYDDERRKTDVELEPLMIKLQVVHVLCVSVLAQCAAYVIALFSQRALRLRERSRRNIGCRLLQRALPAPGMKRFCFSFFAEYQTSINKYSDCSTPPAREVDEEVKCAANFTARRHCSKGSNC